MYSATRPPPNKCKQPGHVFSEKTGKCKTCHAEAQRRRRGSLHKTVRGAPRIAATVQGTPCRTCGGTERYASWGGCVACQRRHGLRHTVSRTPDVLYITLTQWLLSPAPEMLPHED